MNNHAEINLTESDIERFWRSVWYKDDDECWPWGLRTNSGGYGSFFVGGAGRRKQSYLAHRVAYHTARGPIPSGLKVRHTCDNPICCNPHHLVPGTQQQNVDDCYSRGRAPEHPKGVASVNAKITDEDVVELRRRRAAGVEVRKLAAGMPISWQQAYRIVRGGSWAHV